MMLLEFIMSPKTVLANLIGSALTFFAPDQAIKFIYVTNALQEPNSAKKAKKISHNFGAIQCIIIQR